MGFSRDALFFTFLAAARASTSGPPTIEWGPCPDTEPYVNATVDIECGTIPVPLDYTQDNSTTFDLNLLKTLAVEQPTVGTIQVNFGGPGGPGISSLIRQAEDLLVLSGGAYDIVAFDPRGVGPELEYICTNDTGKLSEMGTWIADASVSDYVAKKIWAGADAIGGICQAHGNGDEVGELLGTAFVARDIARIAEAVDDDGLIRYWGWSYGTLLGATLAAMFPERIDRMILDGVLNPHEYYNSLADMEQWESMDATFTYFFESCVDAGADLCPLAALNKTGAELEQDVWDFIDALDEEPLSVAKGGIVFESFLVKSWFFDAFYDVANWPGLAEQILPVVWGTEEERLAVLEALFAPVLESGEPPSLGLIEEFWAIHCSDRVVRSDSWDEMEPILETLTGISRVQGPVHFSTAAVCARWPWHAKESYTGDFNVATKQPVLVMSNVYDGQTSIHSAYNISATFEGSAVLEVNGAGHAAKSQPSVCSLKYMQQYWVEGTLPESGTSCEPDSGAWEPWDWSMTFELVANETTTTGRRRRRAISF